MQAEIVEASVDADNYVTVRVKVGDVVRDYDFHITELPYSVQHGDNPDLAEHFEAERPQTLDG
jgi:hypothetical protein